MNKPRQIESCDASVIDFFGDGEENRGEIRILERLEREVSLPVEKPRKRQRRPPSPDEFIEPEESLEPKRSYSRELLSAAEIRQSVSKRSRINHAFIRELKDRALHRLSEEELLEKAGVPVDFFKKKPYAK